MTDKTHPEVPFRVWHRGGACVDVAHERDEARAMAALWKEATRREVRKVHHEDGLVMRAVRAAQTLAAENSILRGEVEKAERERDEARATKDMHKRRADEERARADQAEKELRQARSERDELRSLYEGQIEVIGSLRSQLNEALDRAAESRPLTPDAINDEMRKRAREAFFNEWDRDDSTLSSGINAALTAALTEPPARPEGAEEIEAVLRDEWTFSDEDGGEEAFADLAQRLASRGVRVVGEGGAA